MNEQVIIDINFYQKELVLSPFFNDKMMLSNALIEFLEKEIKTQSLGKNTLLNFKNPNINEEEKIYYRKAVHYTYKKLFEETYHNIKRLSIVSLMMFLIGFLVLGLSVIIKSINFNIIFIEIFDIVAWVFVWDSVDIFVFKRAKLKDLKNKYQILKDINIVFNF